MDLAVFETWLVGIAALTEAQRRRAWLALALAEAADSSCIEAPSLPAEGVSGFDQASDETRPAGPVAASTAGNPGRHRQHC